jgi:glycosyltransferase involved in cell wall biosynthesis
MDFHEGFDGFGSDLRSAERRLLGRADLTLTSSQWLKDFATPFSERIAIIRNGAEYAHFSSPPPVVFKDSHGRRVLGYYGALAAWFDAELVRAVAERFRDCLVLLVGHDQANVARLLRGVSNVRFVGEVSYEKLPYYLHGFDVCLLPFRIVPLTLATNPVKLYEYLSAGKPVVSVALPEVERYGGLVRLAHTAGRFLDEIAAALGASVNPDVQRQRQAFAAEQTWAARARQLIGAVNEATKVPEGSDALDGRD